ncbi:MAG: copper-binding protein [Planctomycetota bacterium]
MLIRGLAGGVLASAAVVFCAGCEPGASESSATAPAAFDFEEFQQQYAVKGRVTTVPVEGRPALDLMIHHQEIPEFVGKDGEIVGMGEMTMPFPRQAPGVSIASLEPGDPVEFTFRVRWSEGVPTYWISEIETLPEDADLGLRADPVSPPEPSGQEDG